MESSQNLLSLQDIELIELTQLSSSDKHYLRLLGHCLASFKDMASGLLLGPLPTEEYRLAWFLKQGSFKRDDPFLVTLLEQFVSAANQLDLIAQHYQISPLELSLSHLIKFTEKSNEKDFQDQSHFCQ